MSFRLTRTACFAQGAWNIYILQSNWLYERGLLPQEQPVVIETLLTGPGFRYSTQFGAPVWTVTPYQVTVETAGESAPVARLLAELLRSLPHTPLGEVGVRADYHDPDAPPPTSGPGADRVQRHGASVLVQSDDGRYYLERVEDVANRRTSLTVVASVPPPAAVDPAVAHLNQADRHLRAGREVASRQWQVTFA